MWRTQGRQPLGPRILVLLFFVCAWSLSIGVAARAAESTRVQLGAGRVGSLRWTVKTFSPSVHAPSRVCLQLNTWEVHPEEIEIPVGEIACGPVRPIPLTIIVVDELKKPPITFITAAFPQRAASVSLFFKGPKPDKVLPLKLLSEAKQQKTGLDPFRSFTLAFSGRSCLARFVTHAQSGAVLYDGGHMGCGFVTH